MKSGFLGSKSSPFGAAGTLDSANSSPAPVEERESWTVANDKELRISPDQRKEVIKRERALTILMKKEVPKMDISVETLKSKLQVPKKEISAVRKMSQAVLGVIKLNQSCATSPVGASANLDARVRRSSLALVADSFGKQSSRGQQPKILEAGAVEGTSPLPSRRGSVPDTFSRSRRSSEIKKNPEDISSGTLAGARGRRGSAGPITAFSSRSPAPIDPDAESNASSDLSTPSSRSAKSEIDPRLQAPDWVPTWNVPEEAHEAPEKESRFAERMSRLKRDNLCALIIGAGSKIRDGPRAFGSLRKEHSSGIVLSGSDQENYSPEFTMTEEDFEEFRLCIHNPIVLRQIREVMDLGEDASPRKLLQEFEQNLQLVLKTEAKENLAREVELQGNMDVVLKEEQTMEEKLPQPRAFYKSIPIDVMASGILRPIKGMGMDVEDEEDDW